MSDDLTNYHWIRNIMYFDLAKYYKRTDKNKSRCCFNKHIYHRHAFGECRLLKGQQAANRISPVPYEIPIEVIRLVPLEDLNTNWGIHSVPYQELYKIKPRDEMIALKTPIFVEVSLASGWLEPNEPIIVIKKGNKAKGYPIQVLIWHEVINDKFLGDPIVITYCPLCNSTRVFKRQIDNKVLEFGSSGVIKHSCTIMYDEQTESLWETYTGRCIVGDLTENKLEAIECSVVPFSDFSKSYPEGNVVLSSETGFIKKYGENPYIGYDQIARPFFFLGEVDERVPSMERVVGVIGRNQFKAYPYTRLRAKRVVEDEFEGEHIVVLYQLGMASALDTQLIEKGRDVGAANVLKPFVNGKRLHFYSENNRFFDQETQSEWNILGISIDGPLKGEHLPWVLSNTPFWFSWAAYYPDTSVYIG